MRYLFFSCVLLGLATFSFKLETIYLDIVDLDTQCVAYDNTHVPINTTHIDTLYGPWDIKEPLLCELMQHPSFIRLMGIEQYGADCHAFCTYRYNRYTHSVGVAYLLMNYGAPYEEITAGLLHDLSHTAFSHALEGLLFVKQANTRTVYCDSDDSYQDDIHSWYLKSCGIDGILSRYGLTIADIHHKSAHFRCLEQPLPSICADRLEYNLAGGVLEQIISPEDIQPILNDLCYESGEWFFKSYEYAEKFARISLYLTEHVWASARGQMVDYWLCQLMKQALEKEVISFDDIHFSTDNLVWQKLIDAQDPIIDRYIDYIKNWDAHMKISSPSSYDIHLKGKFRGIDPWMRSNNQLIRLSNCSPSFKQEFERVQALIKYGWYISFM